MKPTEQPPAYTQSGAQQVDTTDLQRRQEELERKEAELSRREAELGRQPMNSKNLEITELSATVITCMKLYM